MRKRRKRHNPSLLIWGLIGLAGIALWRASRNTEAGLLDFVRAQYAAMASPYVNFWTEKTSNTFIVWAAPADAMQAVIIVSGTDLASAWTAARRLFS